MVGQRAVGAHSQADSPPACAGEQLCAATHVPPDADADAVGDQDGLTGADAVWHFDEYEHAQRVSDPHRDWYSQHHCHVYLVVNADALRDAHAIPYPDALSHGVSYADSVNHCNTVSFSYSFGVRISLPISVVDALDLAHGYPVLFGDAVSL